MNELWLFLEKNWSSLSQLILIPIGIGVYRKLAQFAKVNRIVLGEDKEPGLIDRINRLVEKIDSYMSKIDSQMDGHKSDIIRLETRMDKAESEIASLRPIKHKIPILEQAIVFLTEEIKWIRERLKITNA